MALIFYIPGVYLEWPSDPWEHWARINWWKEITTVGTGAIWYYKMEHYFFAYSLLGRLPLGAQIHALSLFHTGMSLLLSWQFYRLSRVSGVSPKLSMLFVIMQALFFGNNVFGFYRYYSLSSTVPALIGAVAAIRCFLIFVITKRLAVRPSLFRKGSPLGAVFLASLFAAHQHMQGLAIAGIGIAAILGWIIGRRWNRLAQIVAVLALIGANFVALALWPRHAYLDTIFKQDGWLNSWYSFELFRLDTSGHRRAMEILGLGGVINLVASVILLKRNHVVGWLTLLPPLVLSMPLCTIPFANALAAVSPDAIVVFHRVLLGIPTGLALVVLGLRLPQSSFSGLISPSWLPSALTAGVVALLCIVPTGAPCFNRTWHTLMIPGRDFTMRTVLANFYGDSIVPPSSALVLSSAGVSVALQSYAPTSTLFTTRERVMHAALNRSPAADAERATRAVDNLPLTTPRLSVTPSTQQLITGRSQAAFLSGHWLPDEVTLAYTRRP